MTECSRIQKCKNTIAEKRYLSSRDAKWVVARLEAYRKEFGLLPEPEPKRKLKPEPEPELKPEPINPQLQYLDGVLEKMKERRS
jgi:hypothetical protein